MLSRINLSCETLAYLFAFIFFFTWIIITLTPFVTLSVVFNFTANLSSGILKEIFQTSLVQNTNTNHVYTFSFSNHKAIHKMSAQNYLLHIYDHLEVRKLYYCIYIGIIHFKMALNIMVLYPNCIKRVKVHRFYK